MKKHSIRLMLCIICMLLIVAGIFSGCTGKPTEVLRDTLVEKVQSCANTFIEEYHKEEPIIIGGQTFNFDSAMNYGNQFFGVDWAKYGECMDSIKTGLYKDSSRLAAVYSDYVEAVNAVAKYDKTDGLAYKSVVSRAIISKALAADVLKLIKQINTDEILLASTNGLTPLDIAQYNYYDEIAIEDSAEKVLFINEFSENFAELPYLSQTQKNRVGTFLNSYDVEVASANYEAVKGFTSYDSNGAASRLVVCDKDGLLSQMGILAHEIGHVSDIPADLVSSESVANINLVLSSYYAGDFDYAALTNPLVPKLFEQSVYEQIMNHIFGYGASYCFENKVYSYNGKLDEAAIIAAYDKNLDGAASSYSDGYEIFWQINWKNAAYSDVVNMGHEYFYAALNAVYIWDLYGNESTRQQAIDKYHSLLEYEYGFDKTDDLGLIGDSNIAAAYEPLKRFVIKNYNTIEEINSILFP